MIVYASAKTNKIYYYFKVSDSVTYSVGAILSYFGTVSDSVAASLGPILSYAPTVSDSVSSSPGGISSYFFNLAVSVYDAIAKTASLSYPFTVSDLVEIININYNVTITYLLTVSSDVSQLSGNFTPRVWRSSPLISWSRTFLRLEILTRSRARRVSVSRSPSRIFLRSLRLTLLLRSRGSPSTSMFRTM